MGEQQDISLEYEDIGSDWFWAIIAEAKQNRTKLREILTGLVQEDIVRFHREFMEAAAEFSSAPYFDLMIDSEDGMDDVARWIVSQGKDTYRSMLENPSLVPYSVEEGDPSILYGIADEVYEERFGDLLDWNEDE